VGRKSKFMNLSKPSDHLWEIFWVTNSRFWPIARFLILILSRAIAATSSTSYVFYRPAISCMAVMSSVTVSFVQNPCKWYRSSRNLGRGIARPERLESNVFRSNEIR
jgi:hypothetical protein